jgi:hypothetical protein
MFVHVPRFPSIAGRLSLIAFVAVALACAGGGGGNNSKALRTVKLHESLVFNDSTWVVVEAKDLGKVIKATEPGDEELKADGRFIYVRFKIANTGKRVVWLGDDPELTDNRDRTFQTLGDRQKQYLPRGAKTLGEPDSDQIPAGITREFHAIYEVPADARGLRLKAASFAEKKRRQQEGLIDLGL